MNGQFYCVQFNKFVPCEQELIGKRVSCPLCGGTHDVVPIQPQTVQIPNTSLANSGGTVSQAGGTVPLTSPAPTARRYSIGGLITAGVLLFAGLSTWSTPSSEGRISSLRAILLGGLFLFRAFRPPLKWWQGFLTFVGGAFAVVGLLEALLSDRDSTGKLVMLVLGIAFAAPLLYFGFRRPGTKTGTNVLAPMTGGTEVPSSAPLSMPAGGVADAVITSGIRRATFWERLLAWVLDVAVLSVVGGGGVAIFKSAFPDWTYELTRVPEPVFVYAILLILGIVFEILPTHYFGQSLGKRIVGLQIVPEDAGEVGLLKSFGRFLLKYTLSMTLFLGGLWILFNKGRKSWHDMILKMHVNKISSPDQKAPDWGTFAKRTVADRPIVAAVGIVLLLLLVSAVAGWGSAKSKWIEKAEALKGEGKTEAALAEYDKLIEAYPGFGKSYRMRGQLYIENFGNLERAIKDYEAAVALNGRDKEALRHLVQLYLAKAKLLGTYAAGGTSHPDRPEPQTPVSENVNPPVSNPAEEGKPAQLSNPRSGAAFTRTREGIRPLRIDVTEPLDTGGKPVDVVAGELREKTKSTIMRSLDLDPNDDQLRDAMQSLDPDAKLPAKRPCFVVTAASDDTASFEVRTLSRFRDRYLIGTRLGNRIVREYYRLGPHAARLISSVVALRVAARFALQPIVFWAWLSLNPSFLLGVGLLSSVAFSMWARGSATNRRLGT